MKNQIELTYEDVSDESLNREYGYCLVTMFAVFSFLAIAMSYLGV